MKRKYQLQELPAWLLWESNTRICRIIPQTPHQIIFLVISANSKTRKYDHQIKCVKSKSEYENKISVQGDLLENLKEENILRLKLNHYTPPIFRRRRGYAIHQTAFVPRAFYPKLLRREKNLVTPKSMMYSTITLPPLAGENYTQEYRNFFIRDWHRKVRVLHLPRAASGSTGSE